MVGAGNGMEDILARADRYRLRAHRKARAHYLASKRAHSMHLRLGVPVVVSTTIVGTTIFGTLSKNPQVFWMVLTGLLSLAAAVLAALQTFFRHAEVAEKHRVAAASYAGLQRELDVYLMKHRKVDAGDRAAALDELQSCLHKLDELEKASLDVPDRLYDQAVREQQADKEGV
jgi:hypothetical protein